MLRIGNEPMSGGANARLENLRSSQRGDAPKRTVFAKSEALPAVGSFDLPQEIPAAAPSAQAATESRRAVAALAVERDALTDKCNAYGKRIEELEETVRSFTAENEELSRKLSECELSRLSAKRMYGALAAEYDALRASALTSLREQRAGARAAAQEADVRFERLEQLLQNKQ